MFEAHVEVRGVRSPGVEVMSTGEVPCGCRDSTCPCKSSTSSSQVNQLSMPSMSSLAILCFGFVVFCFVFNNSRAWMIFPCFYALFNFYHQNFVVSWQKSFTSLAKFILDFPPWERECYCVWNYFHDLYSSLLSLFLLSLPFFLLFHFFSPFFPIFPSSSFR